MTKPKRSTAQILQGVMDTLQTARLGFSDVSSADPARRLPGLRNLVVFGRAVTNALQNLRSTEADFDTWYQPYVEEMKNDPLLKYFYNLRSEILKEGTLPTMVSASLHFSGNPVRDVGPPPPHAKGFFIGDQSGGSGWEVVLPDGEIVKYYVQLSSDIATTSIYLTGAPTEHLGNVLKDDRIETIGAAYLSYLDRLARDARSRWNKSGA